MKKKGIILTLMFVACMATAQRQTEKLEHNVNGDEAMQNLDFSLAQAFYQVGVESNCDPYSIEKLTTIWQIDSSIRVIIAPVMVRCLTCLEDNASKLRDTLSMNMLITYYTYGIGSDPDQSMADYWVKRLDEIRSRYLINTGQDRSKPPREKVKMQFFAGYSATFEAPFGLTVGGVGRTVGWYLRFRSNLSFQDYTEICDDAGNIIGGLNNALPNPLNIKSSSMLAGTGGLVIKAHPSFYISAGAGYCRREVVYQFEKIGLTEAGNQGTFWAKNNGKTSFEGVALDLDGTFRIGKRFYGSLGSSLLNFNYLSANAGIGVFF